MIKRLFIGAAVLGLVACGGNEEMETPGADITGNLPSASDALGALASAATEAVTDDAGSSNRLFVSAWRLNVRSGPGMRYPVTRVLEKGTAVDNEGFHGRWMKIDNRTGEYVSSKFVSTEQFNSVALNHGQAYAPGTTFRVNISSLNVRSGPGVSHSVVRTVRRGATVTDLGRHGRWIQIGPGQFVSSRYLYPTNNLAH